MEEPGHGILGRESDLARVRSFIESVPEGPSALLLEGAAGIGKSTLWRAGVSIARARGHRVLACRAAESEAGLSYAALGDLFDFDLPDLPAPQKRALDAALLRAEFEGAPRTSEPCRSRRWSAARAGCVRPGGRRDRRRPMARCAVGQGAGVCRPPSGACADPDPGGAAGWCRRRPARPGSDRAGTSPTGAHRPVAPGGDDPPPERPDRGGSRPPHPAPAPPDLGRQPALRPRDRSGSHPAERPASARRTAPRSGGSPGAPGGTAGGTSAERRRRAPRRGRPPPARQRS